MKPIIALLLTFAICGAEEFHPVTHRRIAQVMSADGADWLVRPERESDERPDQALDAIGVQSGSTVADIGAGVGYFTWRLAARVGHGRRGLRGRHPAADARSTDEEYDRAASDECAGSAGDD